MLSDKEAQAILDDLDKIFPECIVYERVDNTKEWIDITLKENTEVTANEFPHLLTIAKNYGLHVSVYPFYLNQLGIFLRR